MPRYILNVKNPTKQNIETLTEIINTEKQYIECCARKKEYQDYLKTLTKYNKLKDAAQAVLGKIAGIKNITIKELYEQRGIQVDN